jgi:hypothetical protein
MQSTNFPLVYPLHDALVITQEYPSYIKPHVNAGLHERLKGETYEVLCIATAQNFCRYREYEGVFISEGDIGGIDEYLQSGLIASVLLDNPTEEVLAKVGAYSHTIRIQTV